MNNKVVRSVLIAVIFAVVAGIIVYISRTNIREQSSIDKSLVVYCAHDALYAQQIIDQFQKLTGIKVDIRFDSEATKSLGLTELLISEKDNPRCDVFWNNQLLGTADLKIKNILAPYKGPGYQRIPSQHKDPEGCYAGFAARLRVYIVNTDKMTADTSAINNALAQSDLSQMAIAKPMFGTTLSHYAVLWNHLGEQAIKDWHHDLRTRGIIEQGGNSTVKNLVAEGMCTFGMTDTDDYYVAEDAGKPVAMLPIRLDNQKTICIPNTVALIKGSKNLDKAKQFIDFLLSEQTEITLANAKSRQIPLGPVDESKIPDEIRQLRQWAADSVSLVNLVDDRQACLNWLKQEYLDQ